MGDEEKDFERERCGHQFNAEDMPFCGHLLKPDKCPECGAPKSEIIYLADKNAVMFYP